MTFTNKYNILLKKKRDQKELLISVRYKRTLYLYKNNYYGIVGCLPNSCS